MTMKQQPGKHALLPRAARQASAPYTMYSSVSETRRHGRSKTLAFMMITNPPPCPISAKHLTQPFNAHLTLDLLPPPPPPPAHPPTIPLRPLNSHLALNLRLSPIPSLINASPRRRRGLFLRLSPSHRLSGNGTHRPVVVIITAALAARLGAFSGVLIGRGETTT